MGRGGRRRGMSIVAVVIGIVVIIALVALAFIRQWQADQASRPGTPDANAAANADTPVPDENGAGDDADAEGNTADTEPDAAQNAEQGADENAEASDGAPAAPDEPEVPVQEPEEDPSNPDPAGNGDESRMSSDEAFLMKYDKKRLSSTASALVGAMVTFNVSQIRSGEYAQSMSDYIDYNGIAEDTKNVLYDRLRTDWSDTVGTYPSYNGSCNAIIEVGEPYVSDMYDSVGRCAAVRVKADIMKPNVDDPTSRMSQVTNRVTASYLVMFNPSSLAVAVFPGQETVKQYNVYDTELDLGQDTKLDQGHM